MSGVVTCTAGEASRIEEGLLALREGSAAVLRIGGVLEPREADHIAGALKRRGALQRYAHVDGMAKVGHALAEVRSERDFKAYLFCARTIAGAFRETFGFDPAQRIIDTLAAHWPGGARPVELKGLPFPDRILRQQGAGWSGEYAHVDFPPDLVLRTFAGERWKQLGSVLYAEVPETGGALQVWTRRPHSVADWETIRRVGRASLSLRELGRPDVELAIERGELIFFPTHYPHAVAPIVAGNRTSFGAFALVDDPAAPARLWT